MKEKNPFSEAQLEKLDAFFNENKESQKIELEKLAGIGCGVNIQSVEKKGEEYNIIFRKPAKVEEKDIKENGKLYSEEEIEEIKKRFSSSQNKLSRKEGNLQYSVLKTSEGGLFALYSGKEEKILGKGAFGKVKLAQNLETGEWVALKSQKKGENPEEEWNEAIKEEEAALESVDQLKGSARRDIQSDVKGYTALHLAYGKDLSHFLKEAPDESKRLKISFAVLNAIVEQVDQQHMVHRDIKLENLIYDEQTEHCTVVDYGLAKKLNDQNIFTEIGDEKGTPGYMPPEFFVTGNKEKVYSSLTDIFACGVLLSEIWSDNARDYDKRVECDANDYYALVNEKLNRSVWLNDKSFLLEKENEGVRSEMKEIIIGLTHPLPYMRINYDEALKRVELLLNKKNMSDEIYTEQKKAIDQLVIENYSKRLLILEKEAKKIDQNFEFKIKKDDKTIDSLKEREQALIFFIEKSKLNVLMGEFEETLENLKQNTKPDEGLEKMISLNETKLNSFKSSEKNDIKSILATNEEINTRLPNLRSKSQQHKTHKAVALNDKWKTITDSIALKTSHKHYLKSIENALNNIDTSDLANHEKEKVFCEFLKSIQNEIHKEGNLVSSELYIACEKTIRELEWDLEKEKKSTTLQDSETKALYDKLSIEKKKGSLLESSYSSAKKILKPLLSSRNSNEKDADLYILRSVNVNIKKMSGELKNKNKTVDEYKNDLNEINKMKFLLRKTKQREPLGEQVQVELNAVEMRISHFEKKLKEKISPKEKRASPYRITASKEKKSIFQLANEKVKILEQKKPKNK